MDVKKILEDLDYNLINRQMSDVSLWGEWWKGHVTNFHEYLDFNGTDKNIKRTRFTMGMGKVIPEKWANSIYNPETIIQMGNENNQKWIDDKMYKLDFANNFNNLVEMFFALGTGATVEYKDESGNEQIDFLDINCIYPLERLNNEIVSCAFVSKYDEKTVYINIHERLDNGAYKILNLFYEDSDGTGDNLIKVEIGELQEEVYSDIQMFQIYKPAIANNINVGNPLGISIFANAESELKAVDLAFDALTKETKHGRMRVFLQAGALEVTIDGKNGSSRLINPDQDEFYLLKGDDTNSDGTLVKVEAPTLRVESLISALNEQLNLLGRKCGLGDNAFSSNEGTIYTNTAQVISTNSEFYKTRQKHATIVERGIEDTVRALYYLEFGAELTDTVSVQFDDSIIHDKDEDYNRNLQLYNLGIISKVTLMERISGMSREESVKFIETQQKDMGIDEEIELEEDEEI